ncbi:HdeD family acid-resistance protein [Methylocaldum sp. MU1018]
MKELLERAWWMLAVRGAIAVLFGILAMLWPGLTLLWLVVLFAAYAFVGGASAVAAAWKNPAGDENRWLILLLGLVSLGAGAIAVIHPALTALVLVLIMGANALATGILDIAAAIRLRKAIAGEWLLILAGLVSILFGVLVFLFPGAGALALVWLIGIYAIATGVLLLTLAFRARAWLKKSSELRQA